MKRRNVEVGENFVAPFTARFCWVVDANGKNVAEAASAKVAQALAALLNAKG